MGLKDEEQNNQVFPVKIMTEGYVLVQSLTPKWAGKKLNFSFGDLINLSKVAKVLAPELAKQKPMFSEMGENFWEFPKWVKYVNEETANNIVDHALATAMHATRIAVSRHLGNNSPGAIAFHRDMFLNIPFQADLLAIQERRQLLKAAITQHGRTSFFIRGYNLYYRYSN